MSTPRKTAAIVHQPAAQFYDRFVAGIKERIRTAQIKAALAANAELVLHYWEIGRDILASQKREGWGAKIIDRLAADLEREFPKLAGYSARNLKYMRAFAKAWPDRAIVQQFAAQIPWWHIILCRGKNKTVVEYTLRDAKKPIGVAEYRLLPPALKAQLPEASKLQQIVAQVEVPDGK